MLTYGDLAMAKQEPRVRWFLMASDGNEYSADRGDYFMFADDEPILDEYDEPMSLAHDLPRRIKVVKR